MKHSAFLVSLLLAGYASARAVDHPRKRASGGRTSTPSGCLTVRASGAASGEYSLLSAAVAALGTTSTADACIFMYAGTYQDQVKIAYKGALTVYGYTTNVGTYKNNQVTIQHSETSTAAGGDEPSSTVDVTSANFNMYNINVVNTYGTGTQAIALTGNGNQQGYYGCGFYANQDTLYAKNGYQYYSNCYIQGTVDFIFGDASAWFGECTIAAGQAGGSITAQDRQTSAETTWYVIDHCTIEGVSGVSGLTDKVYLGRPWGLAARVIYQYSTLSDIIAPAGWTTLAAGAVPVFEEYENTGDGASTSARVYETTATAAVTKGQLWPNGYSWIDTSY
ncbi:pectin lyase fold/virulence factor [Xylariales sp. PMI_506]|nr:pectin lyase fold/virulence factor [Xylariales sp. PMI_506]